MFGLASNGNEHEVLANMPVFYLTLPLKSDHQLREVTRLIYLHFVHLGHSKIAEDSIH
jgi:hypothetical protein